MMSLELLRVEVYWLMERRRLSGTGKTLKGLINQYLLEFPNGVKRTYIYTHLPTNFRMNTMLAGLCNICNDFGHSNFDELCTFIEELCSHSPGHNGSALVKDVRRYQNL